MYCIKCGKEIVDGSKFCPKCGATQVEGQNRSYGNRNEARTNAPYNTLCIIGAIVSGVSLFFSYGGLAGIGGLILSRMGFKQVAETGERGRELAIAGMVVGGITAIFGLIALLVSLNAITSLFSLI